MGKCVVTYARTNAGSIEQMQRRMRAFADEHGLHIEEEFADDGSIGEAITAMFRWMSSNPEKADDCGIVIPNLRVLGSNERMIRAVLAAYRELGITIYLADTGAVVAWAKPARTLVNPDLQPLLERAIGD